MPQPLTLMAVRVSWDDQWGGENCLSPTAGMCRCFATCQPQIQRHKELKELEPCSWRSITPASKPSPVPKAIRPSPPDLPCRPLAPRRAHGSAARLLPQRGRGRESPGGALKAPDWLLDAAKLWQAAEAEKRKDATVAGEFEIALPHELDGSQRSALPADITRALVDRYGFATQASIN